jgi:hypothetical protein
MPRIPAIIVVAFANLVVALVVGGMAWLNDQDTDDRTRGLCNFNNLTRSYELLNHADGSDRLELARDLEPILDCDATVAAAAPIPVSEATQATYLRMVEGRRWPILEDGAIVGSKPLPSEQQEPAP